MKIDVEGQMVKSMRDRRKLTEMLSEEELNRMKNRHIKSPLQKEEERNALKARVVDDIWLR